MIIAVIFGTFVYPILIILWFISPKNNKKRMILLGSISILCAAPFFFMIGVFSGRFNNNICFSQTIDQITELSINTAKSGDKEKIERLDSLFKKLPLYGYETDCSELQRLVSEIH